MSTWFKKWLKLIGGLAALFILAGIALKPNEDLALAGILISVFILILYFVIDMAIFATRWLLKVLRYKLVIYYRAKK